MLCLVEDLCEVICSVVLFSCVIDNILMFVLFKDAQHVCFFVLHLSITFSNVLAKNKILCRLDAIMKQL